MDKLSYYGSMDQSIRKFKQTSHALSFLSMKTTFSFTRMKNMSARRCVKLAKALGWDPKLDWRDYPDKWQARPDQCHALPDIRYYHKRRAFINIKIDYPDLSVLLRLPSTKPNCVE